MTASTLFIVNPAGRGGALGRRWPVVERKLRAVLGDGFEVARTGGPRDAVRLARDAVRAGVESVIAVGGDGTVHEVVDGALSAGSPVAPRVGLLPFGTGGDLARGLRIPKDVDAAIAVLAAGKSRRIDAGRATLRGRDGSELRTSFVNVASIGLSGLVTELVNTAPKTLGGRASFLIGSLRGIARWKNERVTLRVDGETVHDGALSLACAANGAWFGGGMHVAPQARFDDGLLDVLWASGLPRRRLLRLLPMIYEGSHVESDAVRFARGARIEADAEPGRVWVELDGEPLGTLPAVFEVVPSALEWIGAVD